MRRSALLTLIVLLLSSPAFSDGGMWTFQEFPHALLQRTHGADGRAIEAFQPACRARATSRPRSWASSPRA